MFHAISFFFFVIPFEIHIFFPSIILGKIVFFGKINL